MTEPYTQTIEVADTLSEVTRVQEELGRIWESRELPTGIESIVSLALEEVLSNVLRHGRIEGRSLEIRVMLGIRSDAFEFEVSDSAPPYDPLSRADPDVDLPLEQRRSGGLGVFLVKRLADEVAYTWRDGRNCLRFRKYFSGHG